MTDEIQGRVLAALQRVFPHLLALYWFGSRARHTATPDSDWDFAILVPGKADPVSLWETAEALAAELGADVDLVDLRAASTVMQHQVITTGQRLWGREPDASLYQKRRKATACRRGDIRRAA